MPSFSRSANARHARPTPAGAWLLAGVIALLVVLAAYVQTLRVAVERGRTLRQEQRVADLRTAPGSAASLNELALSPGGGTVTLATAR